MVSTTFAALARRFRTPLRDLPGTNVLLPSLGYFGGIEANRLAIGVRGPVSSIRMHVPDDVEGQVDLRGIELYDGGVRVPVERGNAEITQSSVAPTQPAGADPFTYGTLRTTKEKGAWWSVTFREPIAADEVRVYNRRDRWGDRSRRLSVEVTPADHGQPTVFTVDSDAVIADTLRVLSRITGLRVDKSVLRTADGARATRREILDTLARRAGEGLLTADAEEQRLLASVLPTRLPAQRTLSDAAWQLLGHLLAAERLRVHGTATSMMAFSGVLRSRDELGRLEREVNRASEILGGEQSVVTRHGLRDLGLLRKRSKEYVTAIVRATEMLSGLGQDAMLAYGTLLGVVREGDFLAHDDDVDMLTPIHAPSLEEGRAMLGDLHERITAQGWSVHRPGGGMNFHVRDPETGLHIDVFPMIVGGEKTSLHMEQMVIRPIDTTLLLPSVGQTFKGAEVRVPADPEGFLEERYGTTWRTPDPFHDWPWTLTD
ncbi:LigA [Nocardioidaceae bacterium Broad-1]|nr:LigA [Nocardioidaceae bacterium Broad-1]